MRLFEDSVPESGRKIWGEILFCVIQTGFSTTYLDSAPSKTPWHFDCEGITHQACDFNKLLLDLKKKIDKKTHQQNLQKIVLKTTPIIYHISLPKMSTRR